MEEKEEQENKENKETELQRRQKGRQPFTGTELTLLITPMRLEKHFHPDTMTLTMTMTYLWTLQRTLCDKGEVRERRSACNSSCCKEMLCRQPLPPQLLWHPCLQFPPSQLPQGPSQSTTLLIKEWLLWTCKKKGTGEEFKTYDLVDVNGGLWYGVPIFTFWQD